VASPAAWELSAPDGSSGKGRAWQGPHEAVRTEKRGPAPACRCGASLKALQGWVDADENKPAVVAGDVEAARRCLQFQATMEKYTGYGPIMMEKLAKHLALLVENR
jgi:hypothetical protein